MLKRIFGAKTASVTFAAFLLGAASLVSRLAGLIRDRLLSGAFGAGTELDAYYAAFRAPDFVYNLFVLGAITAGFIPVFARHLSAEDGERKANDLASSILTILGAVLIVFSSLGIVFAGGLVSLMTPGFDEAQRELAARLTRIMFLSPVFLGLSSVLGGILQTQRRFLVYALAPIAYNLGIIASILALAPTTGVTGVAFGVAAGAFLHFAVQLVACRGLGFRYRPMLSFADPGVREIGRLMLPRTATLAVSQVNLLLLTAVASTVGAGGLAVFSLANNLQSFPVGVLGISFAVAAFPLISELAAQGKNDEFVATFAKTVRTVLFLVVPATILFLLLRAQIVRVALGTGRFDWKDTIDTADTLSFFTLSLFAQALLPLVARAFFAIRDMRTPLAAAAASVVLERVLAWKLVAMGMGTSGLALAFSAGCIANLVLLWAYLRHRTGDLDEKRIFRALALMSVAAFCMAAAMQVTKTVLGNAVDMRTFAGIFTQGAVAGVVGIATYVGVASALGLEEAKDVVTLFRRRVAAIPVGIRQEGENLNPEQ
jgi:putative peptidoglycan lipid II flippase